jgi:hypothetical protein
VREVVGVDKVEHPVDSQSLELGHVNHCRVAWNNEMEMFIGKRCTVRRERSSALIND